MSLSASPALATDAARARMAATVAFTGGLVSLALVPALAVVRPDLAPTNRMLVIAYALLLMVVAAPLLKR